MGTGSFLGKIEAKLREVVFHIAGGLASRFKGHLMHGLFWAGFEESVQAENSTQRGQFALEACTSPGCEIAQFLPPVPTSTVLLSLSL